VSLVKILSAYRVVRDGDASRVDNTFADEETGCEYVVKAYKVGEIVRIDVQKV
jgi:hypothetical protein